MKKATFIAVVTTVVMVMLTGCGADSQRQENVEQQNSDVNIERSVTMEVYEEDVQKKDDEITDLKKQLEAAKAKTSEESETIAVVQTSATVGTAEASREVKVPLIPKDQENIRVSALYHGKEIPLYVATEENRAESINNNAEVITVKDARGNAIRDREISIIISGVSVNKVYVVDEGFKEVEELSYDSVDNTYLAQYYMPTGGKYIFLIQTTNGTHYYVTVVY